MIIHISLGGFGRDKGHVVERCHQDTAIEGVEVHVAIKFGVDGGMSLSAIFGRDLLSEKAKSERLSHMTELVLGYLLLE